MPVHHTKVTRMSMTSPCGGLTIFMDTGQLKSACTCEARHDCTISSSVDVKKRLITNLTTGWLAQRLSTVRCNSRCGRMGLSRWRRRINITTVSRGTCKKRKKAKQQEYTCLVGMHREGWCRREIPTGGVSEKRTQCSPLSSRTKQSDTSRPTKVAGDDTHTPVHVVIEMKNGT